MPDWLIVLLILLAMPLTLFIIFAILLFIDYLQWKHKEKKNEDNELQISSEEDGIPWYTKIAANNKFDLTKYEREGMTLKAYNEKYYPIFLEGIKDPSIGELTRDELDKIARDTNTIKGQFEDWYIPGQQNDE